MNVAQYKEMLLSQEKKHHQTLRRIEPADNPYEETEQRNAAQLLDGLGLDWFHTPNGGVRNKAEGGKMKAQGVKSGVMDIIIMQDPISDKYQHHNGVAIELKRVKGGKVSDDQKKWLKIFERQGFYTCVCCGINEVVSTLTLLGFIKGDQ